MNLLEDRWVNVRCTDGSTGWQSPTHLLLKADALPSVPADIIAPRADFRQGAYMFLVGLLQTVFAPASEDDWRELLEGPGKRAGELGEALTAVAPHFELTGNTPFLQESALDADAAKPVEELLIETAKEEHDHFVKRRRYPELCEACAGLALYVRQANAPAGGRGYRVGLRGGGPLTALLVPEPGASPNPLWTRLWLNVVHQEILVRECQGDRTRPLVDAFPWTSPLPNSEAGEVTVPDDCHPMHVCWSMPCRLRLGEPVEPRGACPLCGRTSEVAFDSFAVKPSGINYGGAWRHPLSSYYASERDGAKEWIARKGQPGGVLFRSWPHFGLPTGQGSGEGEGVTNRAPLTVIQLAAAELADEDPGLAQPLLHVAGFDVENAKVRCWYEGTMPVFSRLQDAEQAETAYQAANGLVELTAEASKLLTKAVLAAWYEDNPRGDGPLPPTRLWEELERPFAQALEGIVSVLTGQEVAGEYGDSDPLVELRASFLREMRNRTEAIFDDVVLTASPEELPMQRVITARRGLGRKLAKMA